MIVELTLFSNSYGERVWALNPFNPRNNVNDIGDVSWQDYNSMLDPALFEFQMAYVRKIVREVNPHDNFYFEICNEPFGDHPGHASLVDVRAWHDAIRSAIREEESRLPKSHLVFQVPVERSRFGSELDLLADDETVDAINLHDYQLLSFRNMMFHPLDRFMQRDLRLRAIHLLWTACQGAGKPLVFDEDNAATSTLNEEAWTIHRKRAWTTVCSGGHYDMIDFSMQSGGQEDGTPASRAHIRSWLKHLSTFIHSVDFVHAVPVAGFASELPPATIAATLANPGREYVIYVADARELGESGQGEPCSGPLSFSLPEGKYRARYYRPVDGEYDAQTCELNGGGDVTLHLAAFSHDVVVHIVKADTP